MMDSDIQISSGSSIGSSSSNCSDSGSDDNVSEPIGKETSIGSGSFTSSTGNSQDSVGCTNASLSGNGVRILPPSSMTHGTSASPLQDAGSPSDPVDMTGIGEDDNSERLIYQDALRGGILADDQGLGKTVSMIALILKQNKQDAQIVDLDADDESENAKHDIHARPEFKVSSNSETMVLSDIDSDQNGSSDTVRRELNSKRPAAGTLVVCPASVVRQRT
ncbi:Helicase ATP-binding domain-containing protein [Raphanus sativus]|nr:Helicase ATP-binding domain-containing protein [Raphanus sativus]